MAKPRKPISRRDFLRVSAGAAAAALLEACSSAAGNRRAAAPSVVPTRPAPTRTPAFVSTSAPETQAPAQPEPAPSATPTPAAQTGARIAFVKTGERAAGVRQALALLGLNPVDGKRVFLKPNFNSADPAPGSTHPDVLRALVGALNEMGAAEITLGDRSGMGDTRRVMEQIGVFKIGAELGFRPLVFDELQAGDWVPVQPGGSHWQYGFHIARACVEADAVVQACCIKTHRYGGHFTMSLKNSVGLAAKRLPQDSYNYMTELHNSPDQRRMIAEINTAYAPALVVMDGVEAFISGGPDRGERVAPGIVLAGTDRVALDAAGVAILRLFGCQTEAAHGQIFAQEQIARAVELGLGVDSPQKIEFVTGDADSAAYSEQVKAILLAG